MFKLFVPYDNLLITSNIGILIIIIGGTFFYPLGLLVQILLKRPKVSRANPLNALFTQIGLMGNLIKFPIVRITISLSTVSLLQMMKNPRLITTGILLLL